MSNTVTTQLTSLLETALTSHGITITNTINPGDTTNAPFIRVEAGTPTPTGYRYATNPKSMTAHYNLICVSNTRNGALTIATLAGQHLAGKQLADTNQTLIIIDSSDPIIDATDPSDYNWSTTITIQATTTLDT